MIFQRTYTDNKKLLKNYLAFLPKVSNPEDALKLALEIAKLHNQNLKIKNMKLTDYYKHHYSEDNKLLTSHILFK